MTGCDPELLRLLARADAASPPQPAVPFSLARLQALVARRAQYRTLATAATLLVVTFGIVLSTAPRPIHESDCTAELAELRTRAALLAEQCRTFAVATPARSTAVAGRLAASALRCGLAAARADGALAVAAALLPPRTNR